MGSASRPRALRLAAFLLLLSAKSDWISAQEAAPVRQAWATVAAPRIVELALDPADPGRLVLGFDLLTSPEGADRAVVEFRDARGGLMEARTLGKTKVERKTAAFTPPASGDYVFRVIAARVGEASTKASEDRHVSFVLPLAPPRPRARNLGGGRLALEWSPVKEALSYEVWALSNTPGQADSLLATTGADSLELSDLKPGSRLRLSVTALRGSDRANSEPLLKTIRTEAERIWNFAWFGQSANAVANTIDVLDSDDLRFRLRSCTVQPNGQVDQKGGKFTAFHDGISFYYTVIEATRENFALSATFTLDYINPTPDGQEGFGLLVMDSLGTAGVSAVNHHTNSAGIIATKFEETIGGAKKTSKDTLGARFVTGLTPELLARGDAAIAQGGRSEFHAFSYETGDLVHQSQSYRLTLKKTNTGYHVVYRDTRDLEALPVEYTLYGTDKLRKLDPDHLYLGFAAARGCNVTVGDVVITITDPVKDPPGRPEPPDLVPLVLRVESPQTWTETKYPLVASTNADGTLDIEDGKGRSLVKGAPVKAGVDFARIVDLEADGGLFKLRFLPDPAYSPGPRRALASWSDARQALVEDQGPRSLEFRVYRKSFSRSELYVSPSGSLFGSGSKKDPLALVIALAYARPGQPVLLLPGTYSLGTGLMIERGNDGNPSRPKTLRSAPGGRAVLDFGAGGGGLQVWGDYWNIEGFDIRYTPGNVKGLQIGGSHCVARDLATYFCGDTGLQISGDSADPPSKWPSDNLVIDCVSHDNMDPAANNADGFAAKLTCGPGNVFRRCISYSNIDDGWDLFSKIESGPIGAVLIESCVAFRNGSLSDGSGNGDGNGFKLGGDGIAVAHVLRNSLSYLNGASGITSNSDPAVIIEACTSYANKGSNISLYGKGDGSRGFRARNLVSLNGGAADNIREMPSLASPDNYFWNGAQCLNSEGRRLTLDLFRASDPTVRPKRAADGSIDLQGFMEPLPALPPGLGARFKS